MIPGVNMTAEELRAWRRDPRHKQASGPVGWRSLSRIIRMLETPRSQWTDADRAHARKVSAFVARHTAQPTLGAPRPAQGRRPRLPARVIALRNWGHDADNPSSPLFQAFRRWRNQHGE